MLGLSNNIVNKIRVHQVGKTHPRKQQNTRCPSNVESMLAHRLRRWPNTDSTPGERLVPIVVGCVKKKERKRRVFHAWRIADSYKHINSNPRAGVVNYRIPAHKRACSYI